MKWIVCFFSFFLAFNFAATTLENSTKISTSPDFFTSYAHANSPEKVPSHKEFFCLESDNEIVDELSCDDSRHDDSNHVIDFQCYRTNFFAEIKLKQTIITKKRYPSIQLFLIFANIRC
jgi:hypothetical protein